MPGTRPGMTMETSKLDPTIENSFWISLQKVPTSIQIIILNNKEPPSAVSSSIAYTYFADKKATGGQRKGSIPS